MSASKRFLLFAGLAGLALVSVQVAANSQEKAQPQPGPAAFKPPRLDRGKNGVIEPQVKDVVFNAFNRGGMAGFPQVPVAAPPPPPPRVNPPRLDVGKMMMIEPAVKAVVKNTATPAPAAQGFINPKVQPGKVRWHESLAAASEAAKKSRKPVLLFQLMGKLDDQFC